MIRKTLSLLLLSFSLFNCSDNAEILQQLADAQSQLEDARILLEEAESCCAAQTSAKLIHIVLLNLKDDLTDQNRQQLNAELKRLGGIELVHNFELGSFADVGDQRALSDYELVMKMAFNSKEEMAKYQVDDTHVEVRSKLGPYLAAPPAVYDYMVNE